MDAEKAQLQQEQFLYFMNFLSDEVSTIYKLKKICQIATNLSDFQAVNMNFTF